MDAIGNLDAVEEAVLLPAELADNADLSLAVRFVRRAALQMNELLGRQILIEDNDRAAAIDQQRARTAT